MPAYSAPPAAVPAAVPVPVAVPASAAAAHATPRFAPTGAFFRDVKARVDAMLAATGQSERDVPAMYAKTATIVTWWAVSWTLLMFAAPTAWLAVPFCISLGLAVSAIGMAVMHDANHGSYSRHGWRNRMFGWFIDAMGASSFVWRTKHNAIHHTWTNLSGVDDDLDMGFLARLEPQQPRRPWHRFQHLYVWFLYALLLPKWVFIDDVANLVEGRIGQHKLPRPSSGQWAALLAGKAFFLLWALAVPLLFHPWPQVVACYLLVSATAGLTLAVTFQLAHCVQEAEFPATPASLRMPTDWAEHQLATTVDFAPDNRVVTWLVGGLNFQVEHHLFPSMCHLHYPAIAKIVAQTARDHGLNHRCTPSLGNAMASHYRLLRQLGQPVAA